MDLSATSSAWLLAMGRWLLWMLGEQREKRRGVMGPGTQWCFCYLGTLCHPALLWDAPGKAPSCPPAAESSFT